MNDYGYLDHWVDRNYTEPDGALTLCLMKSQPDGRPAPWNRSEQRMVSVRLSVTPADLEAEGFIGSGEATINMVLQTRFIRAIRAMQADLGLQRKIPEAWMESLMGAAGRSHPAIASHLTD